MMETAIVPVRAATRKLRPGIALAWAGLAAAVGGLILMQVRFYGTSAGWVFLGFQHAAIADMAVVECGIALAVLGMVLSGWGMIVSVVHKSNIHLLCAAGLIVGAAGLICGHFLYLDRLPLYELAIQALQQTEPGR